LYPTIPPKSNKQNHAKKRFVSIQDQLQFLVSTEAKVVIGFG